MDRIRSPFPGPGRNPDVWLFAALLAFWCYETLVWLQPELRFTVDAERDLLIISALVRHGVWPPHGIAASGAGLDLGPLYYLLAAPWVALWPSPQAIHALNTTINAAGLTAFWWVLRRHAGPTGALMACLLYTQSAAHATFLNVTWHAAAAPGIALAIIAAGGWWVRTGGTRALLCSTALFAVGVQIHMVLFTFGPAALVLLIARRRDLTGRRLGLALLTAIVTLSPMWLNLLGVLGDGAGTGTGHDGTLAFDFAALSDGLIEALGARWILSSRFTPWLALGAAVVGAGWTIRAFAGGTRRPWLAAALMVQLIVGGLATALALGFESSGRYFVPIVAPLLGLSAFGLRALDEQLAQAGRRPGGRALTWASIAIALVVLRQAPNVAEPPSDYLTAAEQEAVVAVLAREHGLSGVLLLRRTHGLLQGPFSGVRYLASVYADQRADHNPKPGHWLVGTAADAPPLGTRLLESVTVDGTGRELSLLRFEPAIDLGRIRTPDRPCPAPVPFAWTEVRPEILKLAGLSPSALPDPTRCATGDALILEIRLKADATRFTLQLTDNGHFQGLDEEPVTMKVAFGDIKPISLALSPFVGADKRTYTVDIPGVDAERTIILTIRPRGRLAFLDLF